jgi:TetR/AcrR family transcriptional regulator
MTEDEKSRRDEIIQAALRVFAREGYHKASIKQIGKEAGLKSPSLIYHYFKDKEELLYAITSSLTPVFDMASNAEALLDLPPETVLTMMARGFFTAFNNPNAVRMLKIVLSEALHSPETITPIAQNSLPIMKFFVAYLERQIELGRLRQHDPQVSFRAFLGMFMAYLIMREIIVPFREGLPEADHYAEEAVSIFLGGLRP